MKLNHLEIDSDTVSFPVCIKPVSLPAMLTSVSPERFTIVSHWWTIFRTIVLSSCCPTPAYTMCPTFKGITRSTRYIENITIAVCSPLFSFSDR